jgi:hypothetical protein
MGWFVIKRTGSLEFCTVILNLVHGLFHTKVMQRTDASRKLMFPCVLINGCLPHAPPAVIGHALA